MTTANTATPIPVQMLERADAPRLAYRHLSGRGEGGDAAPTIVFLPGYMSDMAGSKAGAMMDWAANQGHGCLLLDYAGCGESGGAFRDGTLISWRDDVLAVMDAVLGSDAPVLLIGSSMGGWLMLLIALARPTQVEALVGIAAAPDFTDWGFSEAQKVGFRAGDALVEPSDYSEEPYVTTAAFWQSGEANRLLDTVIGFDGPVRLLHSQADADVPSAISVALAEALRSSDVQTILIKDGDHRLSRDQDICLLIDTVRRLLLEI